jgi:hypothetical protein
LLTEARRGRADLCKKGRYAPPVHMIKLTATQKIPPGPDTDGGFSISSLRRPGRQRER